MLGVADELPAQQPVSLSGTNTFTPPPLSLIESKPTATDKFGGVLVAQPVVPDWASLKPVAQQTNSSRVVTNSVTIEELRAKAEKGDAEAQFELGTYFWTTDEDEAVKWFTKAAEQNLALAQNNLGICYEYGEGVAKDAVEAVKWFRKAAEQNDANAQYSLGYMYALGRGVPQDYAEAVKWCRKAADQGDAQAQCNLGVCYADGQGVAKDEEEAIKWYRKAAEQNLALAQYNLGVCYANGLGVAKDAVEAVKWFRKAAEQNDANAQYNLGVCYAEGRGVAKDAVEAVKWYRKAAEQNDAFGQCGLGVCYAEGRGVAKDEVEAIKWYRKAAEQNYANAQYNLGVCYDNGLGVTKDEVEAVKWYRKAANQGNAKAQHNLGVCYDDGLGVTKDEVEAVKWYRKAAEQNDALAQNKLGICYENGQGVAKDAVEAVKWFRKAAEQDYARAQCILGICYDIGRGVPQDYVEAYKWYNLAAAQGSGTATTNRDALLPFMTQEQIAKAQQLAREFKPHREFIQSNKERDEFGGIAVNNSPTATGTGFFITDDGYLISNYHVVKDAAPVRLVTSTGTIAAKVVQVDAANDLALLKAYGRFAPLPIAASRTVRLGNTVATVGFPNTGLQGFSPKLAKGEIASLSGAADDPRYFQISVPVQPGNSGGALVDERGNVIGIVSAKLDASAALAASGALPENVNYAVKSSLLLSFLESVPDVSAKLKEPITADRKFEDVVKSAQDAAVLVLVY